jgi:hypothetical protein
MIANLYKNCKDIDKTELYAVFISNDSRKVPIYHQKASKNDDPVVWVDQKKILIINFGRIYLI